MAKRYFDEGRGNFWYSIKYRDLMNTLTHALLNTDEKIEGADLYATVPHTLVMAAAIGLTKGLQEEVESGVKNRIDAGINGFNNGNLHGIPLTFWAALIVWLEEGDEEAPILRPKNDLAFCDKFNQMAMGGLSYLNKKKFQEGDTDLSGFTVIFDELKNAIKKSS